VDAAQCSALTPSRFIMVHPRPLVSNPSGGLEMHIGAPCEGLPRPFELPGLKVTGEWMHILWELKCLLTSLSTLGCNFVYVYWFMWFWFFSICIIKITSCYGFWDKINIKMTILMKELPVWVGSLTLLFDFENHMWVVYINPIVSRVEVSNQILLELAFFGCMACC
jgi:hypothetical protein